MNNTLPQRINKRDIIPDTSTPSAINLALLGAPIGHSLSPFIYARYFRECNYNAVFHLITCTDAKQIRDIVSKHSLCAMAVTMPLKQSVIPYLDLLSSDAALAGSVNLITVTENGLKGHTTDGEGFVRALPEDFSYSTACIYGTGGAARSVAAALVKRGIAVTITGRNEHSVRDTAAQLNTACAPSLSLLPPCDLFINATPVGMEGKASFTDFSFLDGQYGMVCDLVYSPPCTELVLQARARNLIAVNGQAMLREQAAVAREILHREVNIF